MLMQEERELVVEYGRKMSTDRLSTGTSGNISVCNAEKGLMAISPSGMDYFSTTPEDVVITDLEANIVDGVRKPSSEWALHTAFYRHKPHARAVVHTHSMYCTTFAVLGQPLRAVHYAIGDTGAATVPCAPYRLFGTAELAEAAIEACGGSDAVLLGNHGLVACGRDLKSAYGLACNLEYVAELQYRTMCIGTPNILTDEQMAEVMERFRPTASPAAARPDIERGGGPAEIFTSLRMALNTPASNAILQESQPRAQQARGWLFACGGESLLKRQGRHPCEAVSWEKFSRSQNAAIPCSCPIVTGW